MTSFFQFTPIPQSFLSSSKFNGINSASERWVSAVSWPYSRLCWLCEMWSLFLRSLQSNFCARMEVQMGNSGSQGRYMVSCTLLCQDWSYSVFELVSENSLGGVCKDVHMVQDIPRLIHKLVIKKSSDGGFLECPSFSGKDIKSAIYFIIL